VSRRSYLLITHALFFFFSFSSLFFLFPHPQTPPDSGLKWLTEQIKKPLLLYTDTWCDDTTYRATRGGNYTFMDADPVHMSWFKGKTANVVPEQSLDFYRDIMAIGKGQGRDMEF